MMITDNRHTNNKDYLTGFYKWKSPLRDIGLSLELLYDGRLRALTGLTYVCTRVWDRRGGGKAASSPQSIKAMGDGERSSSCMRCRCQS